MPTPYAYFRGQVVPLEQAKVGVMTHAFNYGTAVFEGIRGNWNADDQVIYLFRVREHFERLAQSSKILALTMRDSVERLSEIAVELVERSGYEEDVYLRPMVYTSGEVLGVRLHNVENDTLMFIAPFGPYLDIEKGARCHTSTWRRVNDTGIPPRAKVTGIYVNSALAKTEANLNGFDEAIMLNEDGHVSEGSGENIFVLRHGKLITPAPSDNVLEGITAQTVVELARNELGIETIERQIDRTELYIADEIFMTGTAAHVTPVVEVDRRPIGSGLPGPVTSRLSGIFFDVIRGKNAKYRHWCTPARVRIPR
jgi:branched-chain amino acid aminotransferase